MRRKESVKHIFHRGSYPGKLMQWIQTFIWDYVEENNPINPEDYDCWIKDDIQVTVKIRRLDQ